MKKFFYIFFLTALLLQPALSAVAGKIDINNVPSDRLYELPVPDEVVEQLEEFLLYHGEFTSVYQIRDIKGVSYEHFLKISDAVSIFPRKEYDEDAVKIEDRYYRLESMMNDEGGSEGLVETWISLFTNPRDVNEMGYFDLVNLPAVSPIDAAAVMRHIGNGNEVKSSRDLRGIDGLSYYGYRNISDYVRYTHDPDPRWYGYFTTTIRDFAASISPSDDGGLMDQIVYNKYPLDQFYKLQLHYGQKLHFGLAYARSLGEVLPVFGDTEIPRIKGYAAVDDISLGKLGRINKLIAGDYIASFGQGIVLETVDYFAPRKSGYGWRKRLIGISGDVSRARASSQTGFTGEYQFRSLYITPFFAYNTRDAILNPDSSFTALIRMEPRLENGLGGDVALGLLNNVNEMLYGSNIRFKPLPQAHIGFTFYETLYDRELSFQPEVIISRMDRYLNQIGNSADAEIAATYESSARSPLWSKAKSFRRVMGTDFSISFDNVVFQGELGILDKDGSVFSFKDDAFAWTANMYWQFENFNFLALYRHYDLAYDNPYQRSYSNYQRYKTAIYEDIYYLNDDAFGFLYSGASQPQAEKGFYYSTRYQLSRALIMNLEHDIWERVADRAKYNRLVARMEYRPVFNYRIRLRQKWQGRYLDNFFTSNVYRSYETIVTNQFYLSRYNRLHFDLIYSYTEFSPRARLVYTVGGGNSMVGNAGSPSRAIRMGFTHNFNDRFKVIASAMIYNGFIWNFEDTDFRITDSPVDAFRGWITLYSRVTDNLSLRFKYSVDTRIDQTNIVTSYIQLDDGSTLQLSNPDYRLSTNDFRLQLDYRF